MKPAFRILLVEEEPAASRCRRGCGIDNAIALAFGAAHSCVLRDDGTVWCWGYNAFGQLGDGTVFDRPVPTKVKF